MRAFYSVLLLLSLLFAVDSFSEVTPPPSVQIADLQVTHAAQVTEISDVNGRAVSAEQIARLDNSTRKAIDEIKKIKAAAVQTSEDSDTVIDLLSEDRTTAVVITGQTIESSTFAIASIEVEPSTTDNGFEVYFHLGEGLQNVVVTVELSKN